MFQTAVYATRRSDGHTQMHKIPRHRLTPFTSHHPAKCTLTPFHGQCGGKIRVEGHATPGWVRVGRRVRFSWNSAC